MSTVSAHKIRKDEEWKVVSEGEWKCYTGLRKMNVRGYQIGWVGYHGPCYKPSGEVSRAVRECRCNSCTLFEESRYKELPECLRSVVDSMLTRENLYRTTPITGVNKVPDHGGIPENNGDVEDVGRPSNLGGVGVTIPDVHENSDTP